MKPLFRLVLLPTLLALFPIVSISLPAEANETCEKKRGRGTGACAQKNKWGMFHNEDASKLASDSSQLPEGSTVHTTAQCGVEEPLEVGADRSSGEIESNRDAFYTTVENCHQKGTCPDGQTPYSTYIVDKEGLITNGSSWCASTPNPAAQARAAFAESTVPLAKPDTEPTKRLIVGATSFFTSHNSPHTQTITVGGTEFLIRSTPTEWIWNFGDGVTESFPTAGNKIPTQDTDERNQEWFRARDGEIDTNKYVTHRYDNISEDTRISVTIHFTGEYSLDNGATWHTIPGQIAITSPERQREICEITATLVDPNHPVDDPETCGDKNYD